MMVQTGLSPKGVIVVVPFTPQSGNPHQRLVLDSQLIHSLCPTLSPIHSFHPLNSQFSNPNSHSRSHSHFPRAAAPRLVLAVHPHVIVLASLISLNSPSNM